MSEALDLKQSDPLCIDLTQSDLSMSDVEAVKVTTSKSSAEENEVSKESSSNETSVNYQSEDWEAKINVTQSDSSMSDVEVVKVTTSNSSAEENEASKELSSNKLSVKCRYENWEAKTIGFKKTEETVDNIICLKFESIYSKEQVLKISKSEYNNILTTYMKAATLNGTYTNSLLEKPNILEDFSMWLLTHLPTNKSTLRWNEFTDHLGDYKNRNWLMT